MFRFALATILLGLALADSYCENGGTFNCECVHGYYGANCQNVLDFCNTTEIIVNGNYVDVNICGLHGDCANTALGPVCTCDPGWSGTYCDQDYNNCTSSPCEHGGTCEDLAGFAYTCICPPLYTGPNCEQQVDFCQLQIMNATTGHASTVPICGDHGDCHTAPSGAFCTCDWGWTGDWCETRIEYNCTHLGHTYPHNSTWIEGCDTCICEFGTVECSHSFWCPDRCAIYTTPAVTAASIKVGCPLYENCVPENVTCAHETPSCDFPVGWCFPVGYVQVNPDLSFPTNGPHGYKPYSA